MRRFRLPLAFAACVALAACGSTTRLLHRGATVSPPTSVHTAVAPVGFPAIATKNTTRIPGSNPIADAAQVSLAVYPSAAPGTHPSAVVLAPTDDWEASLAASVLMASPIRAPLLFSNGSLLPAISASALRALAPTGSGAAGGAQVIRIGQVARVTGAKTASISGADPFALSAAIDRFATAAAGRPSSDVVVASADAPQYAMPAAGWAAESGDPILFVTSSGVPAATRQALLSHQHPQIYVLGPSSAIPGSVITQLSKLGSVKQIDPSTSDPAASSAAFAAYRDPACVSNQPCVHVPGSFGWALRSPGHGYTLSNAPRTLAAAAAAPHSASGSFGPQLLVTNSGSLPGPVLSYFLDYATPGYTAEGPTAAVYNHAWVIGAQNAISLSVQAQVDTLLEAVPQK